MAIWSFHPVVVYVSVFAYGLASHGYAVLYNVLNQLPVYATTLVGFLVVLDVVWCKLLNLVGTLGRSRIGVNKTDKTWISSQDNTRHGL